MQPFLINRIMKRKQEELTKPAKGKGKGAPEPTAKQKGVKAEQKAAKKAKVEQPPAKKKRVEEEEEDSEEEDVENASGSEYETSEGDSGPATDSESEDESEDDEDGEAFDKVDVDLGLYDVEEGDFHGLKALFGNLLDGEEFDSSALADDVIAAKNVQSMIKTDETEAPIGLISILNIKKFSGKAWMKELSSFLLRHCPEDKGLKGKLQAVLSGERAGRTALMLTERLVNVPPQIAPHLLQYAEEELNYACEDEDLSEADRKSYDVSHFLLVSRACLEAEEGGDEEEEEGAGAGPSSSHKPAKGGKKRGGDKAEKPKDAMLYLRAEDEFLRKVAEWSFTFACPNRNVGKRDMRPLRLVMLVPRDKLENARLQLQKALEAEFQL